MCQILYSNSSLQGFLHSHSYNIGMYNYFQTLHAEDPHLVGMNVYVQSELATMSFKKGEELKDIDITIFRLQQEISLSRETYFPKRILVQYMNALSKIYQIKLFLAPTTTELITFLDNNEKLDVYTEK